MVFLANVFAIFKDKLMDSQNKDKKKKCHKKIKIC